MRYRIGTDNYTTLSVLIDRFGILPDTSINSLLLQTRYTAPMFNTDRVVLTAMEYPECVVQQLLLCVVFVMNVQLHNTVSVF